MFSSSECWRKSSIKFRITNTKLYAPVITLSTEENIKLLIKLESGFKRTIDWNKCQSKKTSQDKSKQVFRYFN